MTKSVLAIALFLNAMASGEPARTSEDSLPVLCSEQFETIAQETWRRLSGDNRLLRDTFSHAQEARLETVPTDLLLDQASREAAACDDPRAPLLLSLLRGLSLMRARAWVDADLAFEPCRSAPDEEEAELVKTTRGACLAYAAFGRLLLSPGPNAAQAMRLAWRLLPGAPSLMDRAALMQEYMSATGSDPVSPQIMSLYMMLSVMERLEFTDMLDALSPAFGGMSAFEEPDSVLQFLQEREKSLDLFGSVCDKAASRLREVPACPEREVCQVILGRVKAQLEAWRWMRSAQEGATLRQYVEAQQTGDWLTAFWTGYGVLLSALEREAMGDLVQLLPSLDMTGTVLASFLPPTEMARGLLGSWAATMQIRLLRAAMADESDLVSAALATPRLGPRRPAYTRFPAVCDDERQALQAAWDACPDTIWRTKALLFPGALGPVAGGPSTLDAYAALAKVSMGLTKPCRQALAPYFPLWLDPVDIALPARTALIDISGSTHPLEGTLVCVAALIGQPDGEPKRRAHCFFPEETWDKVVAFTESVICSQGSACPDFNVRDAHELYQQFFTPLDGLEEADSWVLSVDLPGVDLPVEALVLDPGRCDTLAYGSTARTDRCPGLRFVQDRHTVRRARDLRDAVSWFVRDPGGVVDSLVSLADPIYFNDPADVRCTGGRCEDLDGLALRQATIASAARRHLGKAVGMPTTRLSGHCVSARSLRRLQWSSVEQQALAMVADSAGWDLTRYSGLAATESNLEKALHAGPDAIVHVATHLLVPSTQTTGTLPDPEGAPLQCPFGLVAAASSRLNPLLGDGLLTVEELEALTTHKALARVVLLSGCAGGSLVHEGAEPGRSIASELRLAGVDSVLSYRQPVLDEVAARTMVRVLGRMCSEGSSLHESVAAEQALLRTDNLHPAAWAFPVVEGPGSASSRCSALPRAEELIAQARSRVAQVEQAQQEEGSSTRTPRKKGHQAPIDNRDSRETSGARKSPDASAGSAAGQPAVTRTDGPDDTEVRSRLLALLLAAAGFFLVAAAVVLRTKSQRGRSDDLENRDTNAEGRKTDD